MIVALAGGVGGAKLAQGLYQCVAPDQLAVVVNTADDCELYGLHIAPDADTVLYTLAGLANEQTGWGLAGDTFATLEMLARYGQDTWFTLGDRDMATHILRTQLLGAGQTPTQVAGHLARALGVRAALLPMADEPVATVVATAAGDLAFQEYFVRRQQHDPVRGVRFMGIERARVTESIRAAVRAADIVVFCPSNPVVSIGPILAVPGMRALLRAAPVPKVAISPIVAGRALRGPADRMLAALGYAVSPVGVATLYADVIQGFVIDHADAAMRAEIEALGMRVLVTNTVMRTVDDRRPLAAAVLEFAAGLGTTEESMR